MPGTSNLLLDSLSSSDAAALQPFLKPLYLEQRRVLYEAGQATRLVYFPTTAVVSLVVALSTGEMIEAAMIGRDGVVGAAAALDGKIPLSQAIVQLAGNAITCEMDGLKGAAFQSHTLLGVLIRHEQAVFAQAQQSAACMAAHDVQSRLCRWLLQARDLSGSDTLYFTQEFLGEMLGVQRNSITVVARTLQSAGLIKYSRGHIHILDVEGLQDTVCECYETVKSYYAALLGHSAE
jgi:CRP-like cAMP-binding protein